jgi:general secretion pathway protein L
MTPRALIILLAGASGVFDRIWKWWLWELLEIIPRSWRDRMRSRIEAHVADETIEIEIVRPPSSSKKGILRCATRVVEPKSFLHTLERERTKLPIWLLPPPEAILSRIVQVPRSVVPAFAKLLALEIERWTPFKLSEVAIAWRQVGTSGEAKVNVELLFVPYARVESWKRQLAVMELIPSRIMLAAEQEVHARLPTEPGAKTKLGSLRRAGTALLALAIGAFILLDWIGTLHQREVWQQRVNSAQQEYARQREVERKIAAILSVSTEQSRLTTSNSKGVLLASLTAVIPEADWLSEIVVRKETVILRGYSTKPEALLKVLEALGGNREVTLQGELAFDAKLQRQRFNVALRVGEKAND